MQQLVDYAKAESLSALMGMVFEKNEGVLKMCVGMGFTRVAQLGDHGVVHVRLELRPGDA